MLCLFGCWVIENRNRNNEKMGLVRIDGSSLSVVLDRVLLLQLLCPAASTQTYLSYSSCSLKSVGVSMAIFCRLFRPLRTWANLEKQSRLNSQCLYWRGSTLVWVSRIGGSWTWSTRLPVGAGCRETYNPFWVGRFVPLLETEIRLSCIWCTLG